MYPEDDLLQRLMKYSSKFQPNHFKDEGKEESKEAQSINYNNSHNNNNNNNSLMMVMVIIRHHNVFITINYNNLLIN